MKKTFNRLSGRLAVVAILTLSAVAAVFTLAPTKHALAANPTTINFQGKVVNANGTNVTTTTHSFVFRIYNTASPVTTTACTSTATCLWQETQGSVTVTNGVFQVELGAACALTSTSCNNTASGGIPANWSANSLYLTMQFDSDAAGFMSPTIHLVSVPFAFTADTATHLDAGSVTTLGVGDVNATAITIGNITNSSVVVKTKYTAAAFQVQNGGSNEILTIDGSATEANNFVRLGKPSTINGRIVFDNSTNANIITLVSGATAASGGSGYSLALPTTGGAGTQCLQSTSGSTVGVTVLTFASCGAGGGDLQAAYVASSSPATITTTAIAKGIIFKAGATFDSATLFQVQNAGGAAVLNVDSVDSEVTATGINSTAVIGSELLSSSTCAGAGWAGSGTGPYTHTPGSATNLVCTPPATATTNTVYRVLFTVGGPITSGEFVAAGIGFGGGGRVGIASTETQLISTGGSTSPLYFSPSTNFNGTVTISSLKTVTQSNSIISVANSAGIVGIEIRTTGSTTNTVIGLNAGRSITTASSVTAIGAGALQNLTTASNNTAIGTNALQNTTNGGFNTATGVGALGSNTTGSFNTASGHFALTSAVSATDNTAFGYTALDTDTTGIQNAGFGSNSLFSTTTGGGNVGIGYQSGYSNISGSNNTFVGTGAGYQDPATVTFVTPSNLQNATAIGYGAQVQQSNSLILGGQDGNAVNVGIGTTSPDNLFSVSPDIYDTGTAWQSGNTISGSGTTWTANMIGDDFIFSSTNGTTILKETITGFTSQTSLTGSVSQTVSASTGIPYRIHNQAFSVSSGGSTAIRTSTNSTTALQVENDTGLALFGVNTSSNSSNNLVTNPGFETATMWTAKNGSGASATSQVSSPFYNGTKSMQIVTSSTATNAGASFATALTLNAKYVLSMYVKASTTNFSTFEMGYTNTGGDNNCFTIDQTVVSSGWTRMSCSFTVTTTAGTAIYVKQTDAVGRTFFVDAVLLETDANGSGYYQDGEISLQGTINTPVILQNATNSSNALLVQNSSGNNIFGVDTTDTNLVNNPGVEVNTTNWIGKSTSTVPAISRDTSTSYLGYAALKIVTGTTAQDGVKFTFPNNTTLLANTTYALSFDAKISTGFINTFSFGRSDTGVVAGELTTGCSSTSTLTTIWYRFSCSFTTGATMGASGNPYIFMSQGAGTTSISFWVDAVSLEPGATVNPYGAGSIYLNGVVTSPVNFQNKTDSTTAFQIENSFSTPVFTVDTADNKITLAVGAGTGATMLVLGNKTDTDSITPGTTTCTTAGAIYYNSFGGQFRACKAGKLYNLIAGVDVVDFTSSSSWFKPEGAQVVMVLVCGGGGSGGGGRTGSINGIRNGGGGGGGGARVERIFSASNVASTVSVTVGAQVSGGAVNSPGNAGLVSSFGTQVNAKGGGPGAGGSTTTIDGGGGGGGLGSAGLSGNTGTVAGGDTLAATTANGSQGWAGGYGGSTVGGPAEYGGGGGGGSPATGAAGNNGGVSVFGGGGGGAGAGTPVANTNSTGGVGGGSGLGTYNITGGGGGNSGSTGGGVGGAGAAGTSVNCGLGGGGGGSNGAAGTGGAGGAGGTAGGGGGGGGAGVTGGIGGIGGRGEVWVYSW